jgi:uncharacterized protein YdeI (YjbR/CyaY-like superfamily)
VAARDPRIDAYIRKAQPFARPILTHIRDVVHRACPEVEETMKWSVPHFDYRGEMMLSMAAFRQHCVLGFWKAKLLADQGLLPEAGDSMGFRERIESRKDLPSDRTLMRIIKTAMALNDAGLRVTRPKAAPKPPVKPPAYFTTALTGNKTAHANFQAFSPSHKREYVEWVTEAKTEATRDRRLAKAVEWIAEGKGRNWKYTKGTKGAKGTKGTKA